MKTIYEGCKAGAEGNELPDGPSLNGESEKEKNTEVMGEAALSFGGA